MKPIFIFSAFLTFVFTVLKYQHLINWWWLGILSPLLVGTFLLLIEGVSNYLTHTELTNRVKNGLNR